MKRAEAVLKSGIADSDAGSKNNGGTQKSLPFMLIGILVCVVIVLGTGGFIGFDIYKHTPRKPKVQTVTSKQPAQPAADIQQPQVAQQPAAETFADDEDDDDSEYV